MHLIDFFIEVKLVYQFQLVLNDRRLYFIKAIADVLMEQDSLPDAQKAEIKSFLDTIHPIKSRDPATLEMYYSQLTKNDIRKIYEKYRLDHDLFGFTPDYVINFGKGI